MNENIGNELNYVCADCGHHQDSMMRDCDECGSYNVILVSIAKKCFGENYKKCFEIREINDEQS